ncbi:PWWP domain-containing protein 2B isoform X3 [Hyaena hyaena]|uniref:PWWP domain-containing protein 2B isoform X3 n=1 Tax=Hyaena hyaena TaxID=95912 RepID=UPI001924ABE6|nr:PWWP domain-containing protein 2B isoform X3 [Hyaena hyaena]
MEPRAGCRLPVRVEQVVNGALLVTVSCGERSFAGILLDCTKKSGLFGLPLSAPLPQPEDPPVNGCHGPAPAEQDAEAMQLGTVPPPPPNGDQAPETAGPKPPPPPVPPFPPYFEGAPFPPPLWLRSTYRQWVPQPPPRTVKRTRRRLSRNRDPGRLALSPIRLRPRQVLCEKCKSTLSPPEASPGPPGAPRPRRRVGSGPGPDREPRKLEDPAGGGGDSTATARRSKREKREDAKARVPRSPAIKISYSTPQGTGEGQHERDGLAFLAACPRRGTDCARESVWSSDSLDESKSSSSEVPSPDTCDLSGDGASVRSSSGDARQTVPPLTVRLHTQSVSKCVTEDGRTVAVGDIVWGKIHGFPWWPARVLDISLSQKEDGEPSWQEAKVSWFGSPTTSFLSTSKLSPFSEFFKLRFNRKKKGMYRKAITEAANAAQHVGPEIRELLTQFET